jgi:hypothetical protein
MVVTEKNVLIFSMVAQELSLPGEYRAASRGVQKTNAAIRCSEEMKVKRCSSQS